MAAGAGAWAIAVVESSAVATSPVANCFANMCILHRMLDLMNASIEANVPDFEHICDKHRGSGLRTLRDTLDARFRRIGFCHDCCHFGNLKQPQLPAAHDHPSRSDHPRRRPASPQRHRRRDGRGDAAHLLFADPQLQPRLLARDLRHAGAADRAGRPHPGACRRDALGRARGRGAHPRRAAGRRDPAERPLSRRQPPAGRDRVRAGVRPAASGCSGPSCARTRATSAAPRMAPTIRWRPRSSRKACAFRR